VLLFGLLAVTVAAAGAWFLAGRAVRPIVRLTDTAEKIAETGDVDLPVESPEAGEVGRLARSFRTMLAALSASRRQQHRLVMDAGHELRTPLTSLRTNVDLLRRSDELAPGERAAVIDDVDAELGELTDLVTELVDLAADVRPDEELPLIDLGGVVGPVAPGVFDRGDVRLDPLDAWCAPAVGQRRGGFGAPRPLRHLPV